MSKKDRLTPTPDTHNANKGTHAGAHLLNASIARNGFGRSILVDKHGTIIAGNKTFEQATKLGHDDVRIIPTTGDELIAIQRTDLDLDTDPQARELAYADNRTAELNLAWNPDQLALDLQNPTLNLDLYFDPKTLDLPEPPSLTPPDDAPPPSPSALVEAAKSLDINLGDTITFPDGSQLLCADTSDPTTYKTLDLPPLHGIFTSPPYAEQRASNYPSIPESDYVKWFTTLADHFIPLLTDDGSFFLNIKPHSQNNIRVLYVFDLILTLCRSHGWSLIDELCWIRHGVPGSWANRFKNSFEPIYHLAQSPEPFFSPWAVAHHSNDAIQGSGGSPMRRANDNHPGYEVFSQDIHDGLALPSNALSFEHTPDPTSHPARFPISLPKFFMHAFSPPNSSWLDPFVGSGSTLIAARQASRTAYGIDLVPHYLAEATLWIASTCKDDSFLINTTEYLTEDLL